MTVWRALALMAPMGTGTTAVAQSGQAPIVQSPVRPVARYANLRAAIYIAVKDARALADRTTFDRQFARAAWDPTFGAGLQSRAYPGCTHIPVHISRSIRVIIIEIEQSVLRV
jgi:hypothetical protein